MTPLQKDALAKVAIRIQNLTNDEFNKRLAEHSDSIFSEIFAHLPKDTELENDDVWLLQI